MLCELVLGGARLSNATDDLIELANALDVRFNTTDVRRRGTYVGEVHEEILSHQGLSCRREARGRVREVEERENEEKK